MDVLNGEVIILGVPSIRVGSSKYWGIGVYLVVEGVLALTRGSRALISVS